MYIDERSPRVRNSPEPIDPAVATAVLGGNPKES
jgi:hypothetical protein